MIIDLIYISSSDISGQAFLILVWNFIQRTFVFVIVCLTISELRNVENERKSHNLSITQKVQNFLLPQKLHKMKYFNYHVVRKSVEGVCGDIYDFMLLSQNRLLIVIGDVAGHGLPAALLMAYIHGVLRSNALIVGNTITKSVILLQT